MPDPNQHINNEASHQLFISNGKLMISGEYLVLAGADALAMPVRYQQSLRVSEKPAAAPWVDWTTNIQGKAWLSVRFPVRTWHIEKNELTPAQQQALHYVQKLMQAARKLNPAFLSENKHWCVKSDIGFNTEWGLGSSSSLISNIAYWANIDPFSLSSLVSRGSGYDIACARSNSPVIFQYRGRSTPPGIKETSFHPPFSGQLFFVYSGRKQSSEQSLLDFDPTAVSRIIVKEITALTHRMATTSSLAGFMEAMERHEALTASCLETTPVKEAWFSDYPGSIKSLGAWGGDFLLAAGALSGDETTAYFSQKGLSQVIPFDEMTLTNEQYTRP